ncbi:MAG: hypothetical protein ACYDBW_03970 [Sulfuricaulis sp.]
MPRYNSSTAAFAVGAALLCHLAVAAASGEATPAPAGGVQKKAPTQHSRLLHLFLPDSVIHAFKKPAQRLRAWFSHDGAGHAAGADAVKNIPKYSALPAPGLSPDSEVHQRPSLYIGMTPPVTPTTTASAYQNNAFADTGACGTAYPTRGGAVDIPRSDSKSPLLSGLSVGMCVRF